MRNREESESATYLPGFVVDLGGQFTGWRQDQSQGELFAAVAAL